MMESDIYTIPQQPAGSDQLIIELYSEHFIEETVKNHLKAYIVQSLSKQKKIKALVLGGRCGLTAQILLPYVSQLHIIEEERFSHFLEQRFLNKRDISYFFGKEGDIGDRYILKKPQITDQTFKIIRPQNIDNQVQNFYDVIIVQNPIVHDKSNLIKKLISIEHDHLITMIVPGKIKELSLFQFFSILQNHILNVFYKPVYHRRLQNRRHLTGRRQQIIFHQIFLYTKIDKSSQSAQKIKNILTESLKSISSTQQEKKEQNHSNPYQSQELVNMYITFHYGQEYLGVKNFPLNCAQHCLQVAKKYNVSGRALDLGCAIGRTAIQLADHFSEVIGSDLSAAFVNASNDVLNTSYPHLKQKVKFIVGDACNLDKSFGKFNLIFGGNLIDRLYDPKAFLTQIGDFLQINGILILTSPYSWLKEYTKHENWLGGRVQNGQPITTQQGLCQVLSTIGIKKLCDSSNIRFVIKQNQWVYQYTLANMTFWRKE